MVVDREAFLISTKVLLGDLLGGAPEEAWLHLREPSALELARYQVALSKPDDDAIMGNMTMFSGLLPSIIIDHNIYEAGEKKLSSKDLAAFIESRPELFLRAIKQYGEDVLFTQGKRISGN